MRSFVGVALDFAAGRNLGEEEEDDNHATVVFALNSVDPKKKRVLAQKIVGVCFCFFNCRHLQQRVDCDPIHSDTN